MSPLANHARIKIDLPDPSPVIGRSTVGYHHLETAIRVCRARSGAIIIDIKGNRLEQRRIETHVELPTLIAACGGLKLH